ncbi:hypothetical protein VaNZ11_011627 [Volvox africanus]|uniref:Uncharacterized protein n=1 Tax=Volvox africanus TaxID=51714 RepID=A0ABQ5SE33_9CHLO|nr:hypothetical protein VaNZ11_011627 [Volvox africanus]
MLCYQDLSTRRLFRFCLRVQVVNKHGLGSIPLVQPDRVRLLTLPTTASPASAHRLVSVLFRQPKSESWPYNEGVRGDVLGAQHQSFPGTMRTSPVSVARPLASVLASGSLGGSHTQPANSGLAAYGCYRLFGPAHISKRGDCLVARLLPGARLELLSGAGGAATSIEDRTTVTGDARLPGRTITAEAAAAGVLTKVDDWDVQCICASDNEGGDQDGSNDSLGDDGAVAECVLVAAYVELGGSASSIDMVDLALQPAVHHHNGHTYLSVRNLPSSAVIVLSADGDLSHPVNVTPPEVPKAAPPPPAPAVVRDAAAAAAATARM